MDDGLGWCAILFSMYKDYTMDSMSSEFVVQKAKEFLQLHNPDGLIPFPFEDTIARLGDVELRYLATDDANINGAIYLSGGVYNIVINSSKPPRRRYFTIAHELGHYYLHKDELKDEPGSGFVDFKSLESVSSLLRPDSLPAEKKLAQQEREANTFAAEILMPEDKVREFYKLNGDIAETADAFKVSTVAMAIRLEKLRLT